MVPPRSETLYVLRGGIAWRLIPKDVPPKRTAVGYFRRWRDQGLFGRITHHLVMADREADRARVGRDASPTAVVLDSQSVTRLRVVDRAATMQARR